MVRSGRAEGDFDADSRWALARFEQSGNALGEYHKPKIEQGGLFG